MKNFYEKINIDELDNLKEDLQGWVDYVPLSFGRYTDDDYWQKCTKEASRKYKEKRQGIGQMPLDEYMLNDVLEWVEEYPQFKKLINWEKIEK